MKSGSKINKILALDQQKKCIRTIKLCDFKTGCNKVVIELRVVQFWSKIILVISNQTRAARSFDI